MKKTLVMTCLCCALLSSSHTVAKSKATTAIAKPVSALVLQQKHVYLGEMKVKVTPSAIRMDGLGKFHFSLISRAPSWDVTVFRMDDRISCTQPMEAFYDQGLFSNMVMRQKERMLPRGGRHRQAKFSGVTLQQVSWSGGSFQSLRDKKYTPPQVERIFHAAYKLPTEGEIPITYRITLTGKDWMTNLSEEGSRRAFLSTQKISYEDVPASEFQIPTGLTKIKSVTRIVVGSTKQMKQTGVDVLFDTDIGR